MKKRRNKYSDLKIVVGLCLVSLALIFPGKLINEVFAVSMKTIYEYYEENYFGSESEDDEDDTILDKLPVEPAKVEPLDYIDHIKGWDQDVFDGIQVATQNYEYKQDTKEHIETYSNGALITDLEKQVGYPENTYAHKAPLDGRKIIAAHWSQNFGDNKRVTVVIYYDAETNQIISKDCYGI